MDSRGIEIARLGVVGPFEISLSGANVVEWNFRRGRENCGSELKGSSLSITYGNSG